MAKILVIDDERVARRFIADLLTLDGHEVEMARNGREGLEIFSTDKFDMVITDMIMDEVEGIETIMELRKKKQDLKIIAVSGGGKLGARTHLNFAKHLGADKTLAKPFRRAQLLEVVNCLLDLE